MNERSDQHKNIVERTGQCNCSTSYLRTCQLRGGDTGERGLVLNTVHWQPPSEWICHRRCCQSGLHAAARPVLMNNEDSMCTIREWPRLLIPIAALTAPLNSITDTRRWSRQSEVGIAAAHAKGCSSNNQTVCCRSLVNPCMRRKRG